MRAFLATIALLLLVTIAYAQEKDTQPEKTSKDGTGPTSLQLTAEELATQVKKLGSRFFFERNRAQTIIAKAGKATIPQLIEVMKCDNIQLRMSATELLGHMNDIEAVRHILQMYNDPSMMVRASAKRSLLRYGEQAVHEVNRLLESGAITESILNDNLLADLYYKTFLDVFSKKVDRGGHYPGQYDPIAKLGPRVIPAILKVCDKLQSSINSFGQLPNDYPRMDELIVIMARFNDKRIIARLKSLWNQYKDEQYGQYVAISLAKLGHEEILNELIAGMRKNAKSQNNDRLFQDIALLYHRTGNYGESQKWFGLAAESAESNNNSSYIYYYNLACAYAMGNKTDKAVEALGRAVEKGYRNFPWMVIDKELDAVREDPGYIKLLAKYGPEYLPDKDNNDENKKEIVPAETNKNKEEEK